MLKASVGAGTQPDSPLIIPDALSTSGKAARACRWMQDQLYNICVTNSAYESVVICLVLRNISILLDVLMRSPYI
jgi:hypothetical protein